MAQNLSVVYLNFFSGTSDLGRKPEEMHFKESHRSQKKKKKDCSVIHRTIYIRTKLYKK